MTLKPIPILLHLRLRDLEQLLYIMPLFLLQTISQAKPCTPKTIISLFISLPGYKPMQFFIFTPKKSPWDFNVHLSIVCKCIPIVTPPPLSPIPLPPSKNIRLPKMSFEKYAGFYGVHIKFPSSLQTGFSQRNCDLKLTCFP